MLFKLCNAFMGMGFSMLGADGENQTAGENQTTPPTTDPNITGDFEKFVLPIINNVVTVILSIATAGILIYAIVLAVQFFRADSAEAREEAKKRLLYAVVGLIAAVLIVVATRWVISKIPEWFIPEKQQ